MSKRMNSRPKGGSANSLVIERTRFEIDGPASGLCAWIFENPNVGLKRTLFWWVEVQARPAVHEGRTLSPRVEFEWFRFPIKDWRDLQGAEYHSSPDDPHGTAGLCLEEHDPAEDHDLKIGRRRGLHFQVAWDLIVYSREWYSGGDGTSILARVRARIPFRGVFVSVCEPLETNLAQAAKVAARFVDVDQLEPARLVKNEFGVTRILMPPRLA